MTSTTWKNTSLFFYLHSKGYLYEVHFKKYLYVCTYRGTLYLYLGSYGNWIRSIKKWWKNFKKWSTKGKWKYYSHKFKVSFLYISPGSIRLRALHSFPTSSARGRKRKKLINTYIIKSSQKAICIQQRYMYNARGWDADGGIATKRGNRKHPEVNKKRNGLPAASFNTIIQSSNWKLNSHSSPSFLYVLFLSLTLLAATDSSENHMNYFTLHIRPSRSELHTYNWIARDARTTLSPEA